MLSEVLPNVFKYSDRNTWTDRVDRSDASNCVVKSAQFFTHLAVLDTSTVNSVTIARRNREDFITQKKTGLETSIFYLYCVLCFLRQPFNILIYLTAAGVGAVWRL